MVSFDISSSASSDDPFIWVSPFNLFLELLSGSSSMLPNVPSKAHLINSIPAALSDMRCLQVIVVVVKPAYSLKSSGAMRDILKSFCTRTPVISCE